MIIHAMLLVMFSYSCLNAEYKITPDNIVFKYFTHYFHLQILLEEVLKLSR
jgi:hypothetical protein